VKLSLANLSWLLAYVAVLAIVIGGVFYGRAQAKAIYGSQAAQSDWESWREDTRKMAEGAGPVKRRVPKSAEPPALVLMRDHFTICLAGAVLLTSVLFGTFMVFIRGALSDSRSVGQARVSERRPTN
jgi:hypothetical protein